MMETPPATGTAPQLQPELNSPEEPIPQPSIAAHTDSQNAEMASAAQASIEEPAAPQQTSSQPSSQSRQLNMLPTRLVQDQPREKSRSPSIESRDAPSTPGQFPEFDWEDFEARYERALKDADLQEEAVLKEAEELSTYFRAWASAASVQDNERAVKRLRTRQRFVNLSEEKLAQKQQHYEQVFQAFQNALALLKSQ